MDDLYFFINTEDNDNESIEDNYNNNDKKVYTYVKYQTYKGPKKINKTQKIACWYNNFLGNEIINAVTGSKMGGVIGSKEENKYFKIKHCGIIDKPVTLFYYTREEAGRHLMA